MSTSHRARSAEYADSALTCRMMAEALELRAAEELALAREEEIEAEERAAVVIECGSSISAGVPGWPRVRPPQADAARALFACGGRVGPLARPYIVGERGPKPFAPAKRSIS